VAGTAAGALAGAGAPDRPGRRRRGGLGVAAMCAGGGMATALILDVPPPFFAGTMEH